MNSSKKDYNKLYLLQDKFGFIDTPINILSNKLTAIVGRDEPKDIFDIIQLSLNYSFIWPDIFSQLTDCQKAVDGCDYVLHQAALGSVPRSINDPITTNDVNIGGFLNMLVAARDAKLCQSCSLE